LSPVIRNWHNCWAATDDEFNWSLPGDGLVRQRLSYSPDIKWIWRLTEPVGFVMERKMMLGIRERAERHS